MKYYVRNMLACEAFRLRCGRSA